MRRSVAGRRESTKARDDDIHRMYDEIINELGDLACAVSKGYIYDRIRQKTKLSVRTISYIINHTRRGS